MNTKDTSPAKGAQQRWIIVSNRLPFSRNPATGELKQSSGGLVSAISGIKTSDHQTVWVGTAPGGVRDSDLKKLPKGAFKEYVAVPVAEKDYDLYYNGMANGTIWPLFHYETGAARFDWSEWEAYERVNRAFAREILKIAKDGDLIWIHDFHLFLLPEMLRRKNKNLKIGFFLHIPWPSSEIFRQLPVREEILKSLLDTDLIGFHDYSYLRHFTTSLHLTLGLETGVYSARRGSHVAHLGVFPVSIDTDKYRKGAETEAVSTLVRKYRQEGRYHDYILGVDRLDYTKGIDLKLIAFREMLREHPTLRGKVSLIQIAVPTREGVDEYRRLRTRIEKLVGEINGEFGTPNSVPVQYLHKSVSFQELLALYRLASVLLVTSKRDGMNLVCLEYIAAQEKSSPGVTLLSEFTGAVSTLSHAVRINPWDFVGTGRKIAEALLMPRAERIERHSAMLRYLQTYSATDWAESFMKALSKRRHSSQSETTADLLSGAPLPGHLTALIKGRPALIFSDYDGTLVPIEQAPELAVLDAKMRATLKGIIKSKSLQFVAVSGRPGKFLSQQLGGLSIAMASEHGGKYFDPARGRWQSLVHSETARWYRGATRMMEDYCRRVPGSMIEQKELSISWHFRQSPEEFAEYESKKLREELETGLSNYPVTVLQGKKVIEVRSAEANKGRFVRWYLENNAQLDHSAIFAIGDDETDEDMFAALPESAVTVKVGPGPTRARYRLQDQKDVIPFLQKLVQLAD